MSKKNLPTNVAKLNLYLIEQQSLNFLSKSSEIPFESFNKSLHLPSPKLNFSKSLSSYWYTGIPLLIMPIATNLRFQPLKNCIISIVVTDLKKVLFKNKMINEIELLPQHNISFPIRFIPDIEGFLTIEATFNFNFENLNLTITNKLIIDILPSINFKYSLIDNNNLKFIEVLIENKLPFPIKNIECILSSGESSYLADNINFEESYSTFLLINRNLNNLSIFFSIPFQEKCCLMYDIKLNEIINNYPISIDLINIPSTFPTFQPFFITLIINNISNELIQIQKLTIVETNDSIFLSGNNNIPEIIIESNKQFKLNLEFLAVKEGSYSFPSFYFDIKNGISFRINTKYGILIIGNNNKN